MAPTTIELAFLPLKPDELSDTQSKTHAIFKQALEAVAYQPGFSAHYFGLQVKNPDVLQLVTLWKSSGSSHKSYTGSPAFVESLSPILTRTPDFYTAHVSPDPTPMLESLATEVVMINGPFDDFEESLGKFGAGCLSKMDGYVGGTSTGPVEDSPKDSVKRAYIFVGWKSVQAQKDMMTTDIFKAHVTLVSKHCEKVALDYVVFKKSL